MTTSPEGIPEKVWSAALSTLRFKEGRTVTCITVVLLVINPLTRDQSLKTRVIHALRKLGMLVETGQYEYLPSSGGQSGRSAARGG